MNKKTSHFTNEGERLKQREREREGVAFYFYSVQTLKPFPSELLVKIRKNCFFEISDSITFKQSENWENCDTRPPKKLSAMIMPNFMHIY